MPKFARAALWATLPASLAVLSSCTIAQPDNTAAPSTSATVVAVVDGDTLDVETVDGEQRVRIIGIDTPEINRDGGEDDCYAQEARDYLDGLAYGQTVELAADATQADVDAYGRQLRHVTVDGQNVALAILSDGFGYEYTYDQAYEGQASYRDAEATAQAGGVGLWGSCVTP